VVIYPPDHPYISVNESEKGAAGCPEARRLHGAVTLQRI
jgi:hypothetical protein